jgi:hypothetical protein
MKTLTCLVLAFFFYKTISAQQTGIEGEEYAKLLRLRPPLIDQRIAEHKTSVNAYYTLHKRTIEEYLGSKQSPRPIRISDQPISSIISSAKTFIPSMANEISDILKTRNESQAKYLDGQPLPSSPTNNTSLSEQLASQQQAVVKFLASNEVPLDNEPVERHAGISKPIAPNEPPGKAVTQPIIQEDPTSSDEPALTSFKPLPEEDNAGTLTDIDEGVTNNADNIPLDLNAFEEVVPMDQDPTEVQSAIASEEELQNEAPRIDEPIAMENTSDEDVSIAQQEPDIALPVASEEQENVISAESADEPIIAQPKVPASVKMEQPSTPPTAEEQLPTQSVSIESTHEELSPHNANPFNTIASATNTEGAYDEERYFNTTFDGVVFRLQVAALDEAKPSALVGKTLQLASVPDRKFVDGLYKYYLYEFITYQEAKDAKGQLRSNGISAFVVAFRNDKIENLQRLLQINH